MNLTKMKQKFLDAEIYNGKYTYKPSPSPDEWYIEYLNLSSHLKKQPLNTTKFKKMKKAIQNNYYSENCKISIHECFENIVGKFPKKYTFLTLKKEDCALKNRIFDFQVLMSTWFTKERVAALVSDCFTLRNGRIVPDKEFIIGILDELDKIIDNGIRQNLKYGSSFLTPSIGNFAHAHASTFRESENELTSLIKKEIDIITNDIRKKITGEKWQWLFQYDLILWSIVENHNLCGHDKHFYLCGSLYMDILNKQEIIKKLYPDFVPIEEKIVEKLLMGKSHVPRLPISTIGLARRLYSDAKQKGESLEKLISSLTKGQLHQISFDNCFSNIKLKEPIEVSLPKLCLEINESVDTNEFAEHLNQIIESFKQNVCQLWRNQIAIVRLNRQIILDQFISTFLEDQNNLQHLVKTALQKNEQEREKYIRNEIIKGLSLKKEEIDPESLNFIDYLADFLFGWLGFKTRVLRVRENDLFLSKTLNEFETILPNLTFILKKNPETSSELTDDLTYKSDSQAACKRRDDKIADRDRQLEKQDEQIKKKDDQIKKQDEQIARQHDDIQDLCKAARESHTLHLSLHCHHAQSSKVL